MGLGFLGGLPTTATEAFARKFRNKSRKSSNDRGSHTIPYLPSCWGELVIPVTGRDKSSDRIHDGALAAWINCFPALALVLELPLHWLVCGVCLPVGLPLFRNLPHLFGGAAVTVGAGLSLPNLSYNRPQASLIFSRCNCAIAPSRFSIGARTVALQG